MTFGGPFLPKPFHDSMQNAGKETFWCLCWAALLAVPDVYRVVQLRSSERVLLPQLLTLHSPAALQREEFGQVSNPASSETCAAPGEETRAQEMID